MKYTVDFLKSFGKLPLEEKVIVKNIGRPKPAINISQVTKGPKRDFKRVFKCEIYEKHEWLAAVKLKIVFFVFLAYYLRGKRRKVVGLILVL